MRGLFGLQIRQSDFHFCFVGENVKCFYKKINSFVPVFCIGIILLESAKPIKDSVRILIIRICCLPHSDNIVSKAGRHKLGNLFTKLK